MEFCFKVTVPSGAYYKGKLAKGCQTEKSYKWSSLAALSVDKVALRSIKLWEKLALYLYAGKL